LSFIIIFFLFILGACFGSFINVLVVRLPKNESIITPPSKCPHCQTPIKYYHNIPIFSYFYLKQKCVSCNNKISSRYVIIELLTAILFVIIFLLNNSEINVELFRNLTFMVFGLAIIYIDFEHYIIPDILSLPLIVIGLLFSFFTREPGWIFAIIGSATGFLLFFTISFIYEKIHKKVGLGGGDIKFVAGIGTFVGINGLHFVMLCSSFLALLFVLMSKRIAIPFGPFLTFATFIFLIFGENIIDLYLDILYRFI
jgi:leader peptidase (prepilin peptidase)/N-methyltransferase